MSGFWPYAVPSRRHNDFEDGPYAGGHHLRPVRQVPARRPPRVEQLSSGSVQISRFDFDTAEPLPFRVLMLHDLSFVDRRQRTARDFVLVFIGISVLLLALLVVLLAWLQLRRWVNVLIGDIRGKRFLDNAESPRSSQPILSQVRQVLAEAEQKTAAGNRFPGELDAAGSQASRARPLAFLAGSHRVEPRTVHP